MQGFQKKQMINDGEKDEEQIHKQRHRERHRQRQVHRTRQRQTRRVTMILFHLAVAEARVTRAESCKLTESSSSSNSN